MEQRSQSMSLAQVQERCKGLKNAWSARDSQFKEWYKLLLMENKLQQTGMESFVSNSPMTFFDMSLFLLVPKSVNIRIPLDDVPEESLADVDRTEKWVLDIWNKRLERKSLAAGRGGFVREISSFMLTTSWYVVFSMATEKEIVAEIWNPAEFYPIFGENTLIEGAHTFSMSVEAARQKAFEKGWPSLTLPTVGSVSMYDYWKLSGGVVYNAIAVGDNYVKPLQPEPTLKKIPIYTSPVNGLPDRGLITDLSTAIKTIGRSIFESNKNMYDAINRMVTFYMQILRDTASPRWVGKTTSKGRIKQEDLFKRGALFELSLNEELNAMPMPAVPADVLAIIGSMKEMEQEGSLPRSLYGAVADRITGYVMQQVSGGAIHILAPFSKQLNFLIEEITNDWISDCLEFGYKPYGFEKPKLPLPPVEAVNRIEIPGDLTQRVTISRMINPEFSLDDLTTMDLFYPEIQDPQSVLAKKRKDAALKDPLMTKLFLVQSLREQARSAAESDPEFAKLLSQTAEGLINQVNPQQQAQLNKQIGQTASVPQEIEEQFPT